MALGSAPAFDPEFSRPRRGTGARHWPMARTRTSSRPDCPFAEPGQRPCPAWRFHSSPSATGASIRSDLVASASRTRLTRVSRTGGEGAGARRGVTGSGGGAALFVPAGEQQPSRASPALAALVLAARGPGAARRCRHYRDGRSYRRNLRSRRGLGGGHTCRERGVGRSKERKAPQRRTARSSSARYLKSPTAPSETQQHRWRSDEDVWPGRERRYVGGPRGERRVHRPITASGGRSRVLSGQCERLPAKAERLAAKAERPSRQGRTPPGQSRAPLAQCERLPTKAERLPANPSASRPVAERLPANAERLPANPERLLRSLEHLPAAIERETSRRPRVIPRGLRAPTRHARRIRWSDDPVRRSGPAMSMPRTDARALAARATPGRDRHGLVPSVHAAAPERARGVRAASRASCRREPVGIAAASDDRVARKQPLRSRSTMSVGRMRSKRLAEVGRLAEEVELEIRSPRGRVRPLTETKTLELFLTGFALAQMRFQRHSLGDPMCASRSAEKCSRASWQFME